VQSIFVETAGEKSATRADLRQFLTLAQKGSATNGTNFPGKSTKINIRDRHVHAHAHHACDARMQQTRSQTTTTDTQRQRDTQRQTHNAQRQTRNTTCLTLHKHNSTTENDCVTIMPCTAEKNREKLGKGKHNQDAVQCAWQKKILFCLSPQHPQMIPNRKKNKNGNFLLASVLPNWAATFENCTWPSRMMQREMSAALVRPKIWSALEMRKLQIRPVSTMPTFSFSSTLPSGSNPTSPPTNGPSNQPPIMQTSWLNIGARSLGFIPSIKIIDSLTSSKTFNP
jgi:hypothetical protein